MLFLLASVLAIPLGLDLYMPVPETNPVTTEKIELGRRGNRNVPAIINRGYGRAFFWDGHIPTLEEQVLQPIQNPKEMDLTLAEASARVGLAPDEIADALASYVRSILSGESPYDRFVNGDREALTAEQQLGLQIFRGKGNCTVCHVGPTFTDEELHNTGVAWRNDHLADEGAGRGDSDA
jgi:cytochrome c peroxidase